MATVAPAMASSAGADATGQGLLAAQALLSAAVTGGCSRQVAAAVAAALWRLVVYAEGDALVLVAVGRLSHREKLEVELGALLRRLPLYLQQARSHSQVPTSNSWLSERVNNLVSGDSRY